MAEEIDLNFIAKRIELIISEQASQRDDIGVLTAMVLRIDGSMNAILAELRATHTQIARMNDRPLMKALAEVERLRARVTELVKLLDIQLGTPCEQVRHEQEVARLQELLGGDGANRYWEGRWRDEAAEVERLQAALQQIANLQAQSYPMEPVDVARRALEPKP